MPRQEREERTRVSVVCFASQSLLAKRLDLFISTVALEDSKTRVPSGGLISLSRSCRTQPAVARTFVNSGPYTPVRFTQNPRKKKERFGCGMQFSEGRSRIFLLEGGWWPSRTQIPNQTRLLPTNAVQRWAMQNSTRKALFNISLSAFETTTTTTSKIWPLARGFLPYKRESKDYKSY